MSKILEELAQDLEQKIIQAIENGVAPWLKPWSNDGLLPHNPYTGSIYKGFNAIRLMLDGYENAQYLTFAQIKSLGGYVRSGEKASYVLYAGQNQLKPEQIENESSRPKSMIFQDEQGNLYQKVFKKFPIFNISQCENIDIEKLQTHQKSKGIDLSIKPRDKFVENPLIEQILTNSQIPIIHHHKDKAYYSPKEDKIYLPPKESFVSKEQYYSTALHELGHATGHPSRMNRDLRGEFGSQGYAKEELRAELYSFLQALELGIDHDLKNHASYIDSWLKILKDNRGEISKAMKDSVGMVGFVKEQWYPSSNPAQKLEQERQPAKMKRPQQENAQEHTQGISR